MTHQAKNFDLLLGKLQGLSDLQLKAHFGLYQGYVKKINEIEERLSQVDQSTANYSFGEVSELLRRHSVAYNGTYLHQYYFENITPNPTQASQALKGALETQFGGLEKAWSWIKAGILSGHGWVLLERCRIDGKLRCSFLEEHHRGNLVDHDILLSVDGWEHAYMIDYGTKKPDYLQSLSKLIDWDMASKRFEQSIKKV